MSQFFRAAALAAVFILPAPAALAQSSQSYDARSLSVENFIGRIEVRTGQGSGITVQLEPGSGGHDLPGVSLSGGVVSVDGGQSVHNRNCRRQGDEIRIGSGRGFLGLFGGGGEGGALTEFPALIVTAPEGVDLVINRSIYQGSAGNVGAATVALNSCGAFTLGDIAGDARLAVNGSGDLNAGAIGGDARLSVNGSGDLRTGNVGGAARLSVNGSGDIVTAALNDASISINGSGDIRADRLDGSLDVSINGSGDVRIGAGRASPFQVGINGSGDVNFGGEAVDVQVRISGSGDVRAASYSGTMSWRGPGRRTGPR